MLKNKKGTVSEEAIFQLIYMSVLTIPVVALMFFIPGMVLDNVYDTQNLENEIYQLRILNAITSVSFLSQKQSPIIIDTNQFQEERINQSFDEKIFKKEIGFLIHLPALEEKTLYFNKEFYEIAKPLTPVRYLNFVSTYKVYLSDKKQSSDLVIDQVFNPRVVLDDD